MFRLVSWPRLSRALRGGLAGYVLVGVGTAGPGGGAVRTVAVARADEVQLSGGTQIEGKATRRGDQVVIETESGQIALSSDMVQRIVRRESPVQRYEDRAHKLQPADIAGRIALANYARDHGMRSREVALLKEVLELDSNHPGARERLGYVKTASGWITRDEQRRAQGLIKRDGAWLTPERAAELDRLRAEADAAARERERAQTELEAKRVELEKRKLELAAEEQRPQIPAVQPTPVYGYGTLRYPFRGAPGFGYGSGPSYSAPPAAPGPGGARSFPINGVRDPRDRSWPINGVRDPRSY